MKTKTIIMLVFLSLFWGCKIKPITYLALGDSYTIGESIDDNLRWPVQLANKLKENGNNINDPLIIAKTGWTTDELLDAMEKTKLNGPYDLVTLLIGVNNQYRGRDVEEYRVQYKELLNKAVILAGNKPERVYVLSIPDWGVTTFAEGRDRAKIGSEIDLFNSVKKTETIKAGVKFIDITEISRNAESDKSLLAKDGLHPSGKMYSIWVKELLFELPGNLKK